MGCQYAAGSLAGDDAEGIYAEPFAFVLTSGGIVASAVNCGGNYTSCGNGAGADVRFGGAASSLPLCNRRLARSICRTAARLVADHVPLLRSLHWLPTDEVDGPVGRV
jgi:hypothetical protein